MQVFQTMSDEELMLAFQQKENEEIFQTLMNRYYSAAMAFAVAKLNDEHAAMDAVQETFCRVVRKKNSYTDQRSFAAWFYTVLRNICFDNLRKESRYRNYLQQLILADASPISAVKDSFDDLIAPLQDFEKELLVARFVNGLSLKQAAAISGCSEEAAKKRCQRALKKLRSRVLCFLFY